MQLKNMKFMILLILTVYLISMALSFSFLDHWYSQAGFDQLSQICQLIAETTPEAEQPLLAVLKQYKSGDWQRAEESRFLLQHGYKRRDFRINGRHNLWIAAAGSFVSGSLLFIFVLFHIGRQKRKRIEELTLYLEKVNLSGTGTIVQIKEDEFSLLQDEIYKTVTTLYQTKEAALKAKESYADNLANIAHQLKTSITAASISLQLTKEKESFEYVEQARRQLKRLNNLEEALLMLSRIDSGTLKLQYTSVDIYTVLNLAADNLSELLAAKNITVSIPENGCVTISGDMDWTMEAMINLMKNCMEHSSENGTIYCDYSGNPLYTQILIWDEGNGFAKEDLPHLFERFYRGKNAADGSIGIGLSLAKSIFEMQNGYISAKNMPDGGACFEIRVYSH